MQLFLANGWTPCSANDLCNVPAEASPYKALFRRVNAIAEQHKQHPYDAAALRTLNRVQAIPLQTFRTPRTSSLAAAPASSLKRSVTLT